MKIKYLLGMVSAVALSHLALAKMPFSNDIFGRVESTLDHCAQVDHVSAEKYHAKKKEVAKDATESEVAEARNSDDYKAAYKDMTEQLTQTPKDEVMQACTASLRGSK